MNPQIPDDLDAALAAWSAREGPEHARRMMADGLVRGGMNPGQAEAEVSAAAARIGMNGAAPAVLNGNGQRPQQPAGFDFSAIYRSLPRLTEVNGLSLPDAFLWYLRNGYNVRPQREGSGGRMLVTPRGQRYSYAVPPPAPDEAQWLAANWEPGWQVAMIMSESSRLLAVDVDDLAAWDAFQQAHGQVRSSAEQRTPKGLHLVFQRPEDPAGLPSHLAPGVEVKRNGIITVAPSVRADGGRYAWLDGSTEPYDMPDSLMASVTETRLDRRTAELEFEREARRRADAREYAQAAGERRFLPFSEVEQIPKPKMLLNEMLTAGGIYGLAGPPEAGKSLMLRDWLCTLAARGTPCLYAVSEGQFDLIDRFSSHALYPAARANLKFLDGPLSLASADDVRWLADRMGGSYGAVAFDMVYGFGLPDDDGTKGVAPVINGAKELARLTGCCVIMTGHPGHNGERRFRGSSMWRGAFDGEFHMGGGEFTCEKHKYSDKRRFRYHYSISYPHLQPLGTTGQLDRAARQMQAIEEDRRAFPYDSENKRAERLAGPLGMHKDSVRKLIRGFRQAQADE